MSSLFLMVTITDRRSTDAFLQLYQQRGVDVNLRTVGSGTAVRETLATLGTGKDREGRAAGGGDRGYMEGPSGQTSRRKIAHRRAGHRHCIHGAAEQHRRQKGADVPHPAPAADIEEESTLKDTRYELLLVIANQGHTGTIMDAARAAGAGGGTVIHAKGTGMEGAAQFLGVELVNEKELVLIVSRTTLKNQIMQAIMQGADPKAGAIVFSLPVTDTAGLRLLDEE